MASASEAFALLRNMARGAESAALPLPARDVAAEVWRGLGFNVGANRLVSALGEIDEVLAEPVLTPIPGTRAWVTGLANVRGRLVPVVDLCRYLGLEPSTPRSEWRVLVVEDGELLCGLMVEQSFGMMQFELPDHDPDPGEPTGTRLDAYLRGSFRSSGRQWRVMDIRALVREPEFFEVAA
jgi:twitching motility protein PilI